MGGTRTVTAEITGQGWKLLVKVTIDVDGAKGTKTASVTAAGGHPLRVPELSEWIDAKELVAGERLLAQVELVESGGPVVSRSTMGVTKAAC